MTREQHDFAEGNCPAGCPWCEAEQEDERRAHELGLCDWFTCPVCFAEMEEELRRHEEQEAYCYARAEWGW